ncbi:MAG TPA: tol-pal system protein YbgF [Thermoanaerobaculia bacterium]|nr:tol-pal system protein YbgF [Thermoanaerobaculia bacterium]
MNTLRSLAGLALVLLVAGCASSGDLEKEQQRVSDLQEELANVKRTSAGKEEVQGVNQRIAEQTETLLKSNATLVAKVGALEDRLQTTQGAVEQASYRIDRLAEQLTQSQHEVAELRARVDALSASASAAPPAAGGTPVITGTPATGEMTVPPPPASSEDPMQTYQAAYRDYQRGNYDLAMEGFADFLAGNPNSDLADNASYWIGESLFSQKKYREAIEQFDSVVTKYPKSDKVPGALLKKGYAYIAINERAQGVVQLQYVVHEHPKSQEASLARQRLKQLGIDTK